MTQELQLAICDTETSGLVRPKPPATGVVQVAAVLLNHDLSIKQEIMHYVNPGCPIEAGAAKVHGITMGMVKDKPSLHEVFHLEGPTMFIAHNAKFDLPRLADCVPDCTSVLCTLVAARKYIPEAPNHKLTTLIEYLGLEAFDAHDALGDVKMTRNLLVKLLEITGMNIHQMQKDTVKVKIPTEMPFGKYKGQPLSNLPMGYISYMLGLPDIDTNVRKGLEMQKRARGNT